MAMDPGGVREDRVDAVGAVADQHRVLRDVRAGDPALFVEAAFEFAGTQATDVKIKVDGANVMVNDAKVTKTDIAASNGVIHVIGKVLIPN